MKKLLRFLLLPAAALVIAAPAFAGDITLSMQNGRVTLIAQNAPVRQILAEWARVGQTTIVNADKVVGPPVTLQLVNVPEQEALEVVLGSVSGYLAAPRAIGSVGVSAIDRIVILPTSSAPAMSTVTPPPAYPRPMPMQMMPVDGDSSAASQASAGSSARADSPESSSRSSTPLALACARIDCSLSVSVALAATISLPQLRCGTP